MKTKFSFYILLGACSILQMSRAQVIRHVPGDYATIQAAVDAAGYGDTILVAQGTYIENIRIQGNNKIVTLASNFILSGDTNDINNTIIDASQPQNPDFGMGIYLKNMDSTLMPRIIGFTITGGTGYYKTYGGGIYSSSALPVISHNHIYDCSVTGTQPCGAGIYIGNSSDSVTVCLIDHNFIRNCYQNATANTLVLHGAGIHISEANVLIEENEISYNVLNGNTTIKGGGAGIYIRYGTPAPFTWNATIRNNTITHNVFESWDASGAGICLDDLYGRGVFLVEGNTISNNECKSLGSGGDAKGAGIYVYNPASGVVITGNVISNNKANTGPGGSEKFAGGIYIEADLPFAEGALPLIEKNYITGNQAVYGAGVMILSKGSRVINNFISGNQAGLRAGALYFQGYADSLYATEVTNNTITGNVVSDQGGVGGSVYFSDIPEALLMNNIFYGNQSEQADELWITSSAVEMYNCDVNTDEIHGDWSGEGNLYADPELIDQMTWDCADPGPCWDTGRESVFAFGKTFSAPSTCILNNPRPSDNAVDIGACEVILCTGTMEIQNPKLKTRNYPNPFTEITTIEYVLEDKYVVNLLIYNQFGQQVAVLVNSRQAEGNHQVRWEATGMPAGVYFYRLTTDDRRLATGKMVVK